MKLALNFGVKRFKSVLYVSTFRWGLGNCDMYDFYENGWKDVM